MIVAAEINCLFLSLSSLFLYADYFAPQGTAGYWIVPMARSLG